MIVDKTEYHIDVTEHGTDAINLLAQTSGLSKQVRKNLCNPEINCIFITINIF